VFMRHLLRVILYGGLSGMQKHMLLHTIPNWLYLQEQTLNPLRSNVCSIFLYRALSYRVAQKERVFLKWVVETGE